MLTDLKNIITQLRQDIERRQQALASLEAISDSTPEEEVRRRPGRPPGSGNINIKSSGKWTPEQRQAQAARMRRMWRKTRKAGNNQLTKAA